VANYTVDITELLLPDEEIKEELKISGQSETEYLYRSNKRFFIVNKRKTKITEFDNDKISGMQYLIERPFGLILIISLLFGASIGIAIAITDEEIKPIFYGLSVIFFALLLLIFYVNETLKIYISGASEVKIKIGQYTTKPGNTGLKQLLKKLREKQ
jgi:hypothetical protein